MMVSLINDYYVFGSSDDKTMEILYVKIGKENSEKISETLYYLKKEATKRDENHANGLTTILDFIL